MLIKIVSLACMIACGGLALIGLTEPAPAQSAKAVKCTQFDSSMVKSTTVLNTKVYKHTVEAAVSAGIVERCTAEFPPFNVCSLSRVSEGGKHRSCEVTWATGIVNQGRWLLRAENNDAGGNALVCAMVCY